MFHVNSGGAEHLIAGLPDSANKKNNTLLSLSHQRLINEVADYVSSTVTSSGKLATGNSAKLNFPNIHSFFEENNSPWLDAEVKELSGVIKAQNALCQFIDKSIRELKENLYENEAAIKDHAKLPTVKIKDEEVEEVASVVFTIGSFFNLSKNSDELVESINTDELKKDNSLVEYFREILPKYLQEQKKLKLQKFILFDETIVSELSKELSLHELPGRDYDQLEYYESCSSKDILEDIHYDEYDCVNWEDPYFKFSEYLKEEK